MQRLASQLGLQLQDGFCPAERSVLRPVEEAYCISAVQTVDAGFGNDQLLCCGTEKTTGEQYMQPEWKTRTLTSFSLHVLYMFSSSEAPELLCTTFFESHNQDFQAGTHLIKCISRQQNRPIFNTA